MTITMETLIGVNARYHHQHRVTESDVQKANEIVRVIEQTRNNAIPQPGDIVQYTTKHGNYYAKAHIEGTTDGRLSICENPSTPFVTVYDGIVRTNTSGGAWASIPANLEHVGVANKAFVHWGHCGPCGNGAFTVIATVNVWRYTDGNPEFSTEHHDMFYATHLDKPDTYGYTHIVTSGYSTPHTAFRTEGEYHDWLTACEGAERPAAWANSRIVWVKKPA
jgi:hypothetical protein